MSGQPPVRRASKLLGAFSLGLGAVQIAKGLDQAPEGFETFKHRTDECMKVVFTP